MPEVYCSVANCYFWDQGNLCGADAIMVEVDAHAERKFNEEIGGEMIDTTHQDHASHSADTCCHTFKPKH